MKWLLRSVVGLIAVYVMFFSAVAVAMLQPPPAGAIMSGRG